MIYRLIGRLHASRNIVTAKLPTMSGRYNSFNQYQFSILEMKNYTMFRFPGYEKLHP